MNGNALISEKVVEGYYTLVSISLITFSVCHSINTDTESKRINRADSTAVIVYGCGCNSLTEKHSSVVTLVTAYVNINGLSLCNELNSKVGPLIIFESFKGGGVINVNIFVYLNLHLIITRIGSKLEKSDYSVSPRISVIHIYLKLALSFFFNKISQRVVVRILIHEVNRVALNVNGSGNYTLCCIVCIYLLLCGFKHKNFSFNAVKDTLFIAINKLTVVIYGNVNLGDSELTVSHLAVFFVENILPSNVHLRLSAYLNVSVVNGNPDDISVKVAYSVNLWLGYSLSCLNLLGNLLNLRLDLAVFHNVIAVLIVNDLYFLNGIGFGNNYRVAVLVLLCNKNNLAVNIKLRSTVEVCNLKLALAYLVVSVLINDKAVFSVLFIRHNGISLSVNRRNRYRDKRRPECNIKLHHEAVCGCCLNVIENAERGLDINVRGVVLRSSVVIVVVESVEVIGILVIHAVNTGSCRSVSRPTLHSARQRACAVQYVRLKGRGVTGLEVVVSDLMHRTVLFNRSRFTCL